MSAVFGGVAVNLTKHMDKITGRLILIIMITMNCTYYELFMEFWMGPKRALYSFFLSVIERLHHAYSAPKT